MQNLAEAGKNEKINIFDLAEYLALACGIKIEREDRRMIELVNRAYNLCVPGYKEPDLS